MILREAIQQNKGFRYMVEQLNIRSAAGRRVLYDLPWLNSKNQLETEFSRIRTICELLDQPTEVARIEQVWCKLIETRDIRGTIKRTAANCVLDDLELFELKNFALLAGEISELIKAWRIVELPDLEPVVRLLDPEKKRIPYFYICDAFSPGLAELRAEIKRGILAGNEERLLEELYQRSVSLEDAIRADLSEQLYLYQEALKKALEEIAVLDIVLAKAEQVREMQLVCPEIREEGSMVFAGLFHPQLKAILNQEGKHFQGIDLELRRESTVISGANMAGKTILLKSVGLAQYLLQFGFWVPAGKATMVLVDQVLTSIGDAQDELNGLSSFAAEMLRVNGMIEQVNKACKVLVLIDELARTTNPVEGRAIVNGVVDYLSGHRVMAMITTHYAGITAKCRKLRVKGFVENRVHENMTLKNINEFIDYSLEEDNQVEVPREAMRIAWMLGVDHGLLERVEDYLRDTDPGLDVTVQ